MIMQILSIHLKNIKSHRDTELQFSPGINVLSGPNGVGKSTIFEAIGYALFGVDAQSFVGNVERFISIGAKKGEIAVEFQLEKGECYRISRTVEKSTKWLLAKEVGGNFEVEEHKDSKETEARLKELLGLDNGRSLAEQFELVIGPFQNEFLGPFVEKRPTARSNRFDEILGIDTWRKTYNETKVLASTIKAKVEALESAIGPLREQLVALPVKIEDHKTAKKTLGEAEKGYKEKDKGLKAAEVRLIEIDRREQAVRNLGIEIEKLKERIGNGQEKIGSQKLLIEEAETSQQIIAANTVGKQAYEQAEQRLVALREKLKLQRQLERDAAALDKQVSTLTERYASELRIIEQAGRDLHNEEHALAEKRKELAIDEKLQQLAASLPEIHESIKGVRAQLGQLEGRRSGLEEGQEKLFEGICPFFHEPCLNIAERPPGDVFSVKFAELDVEHQRLNVELARLEKNEFEASKASEQLKAFEVQLKGLDEQVARLEVRRKNNEERAGGVRSLQQARKQSENQLNEKRRELLAYANLQAEIETNEAEQLKNQTARDLYVANKEQADKLGDRLRDLQKFEQLLAQLLSELVGKERDLKTACQEYDPEQHQELRAQKDALSREVGALEQKVVNLKTDIERLAGEIEKLKQIEEEIAAKQAQIKAYGEKEDLVKFLRNRVFRNVSTYLSERFREEISQRANAIYRIIAEVDEELYWGENYQIVLRDLADGELRERSDDQLSGGQTMSAVVALRLAMLQTIGARIAFFDEPTSNLDASRRENLAHAFRAIDVGREEVTEHWYDQLFLISHDVAFTEITDQVIPLG